MKVEVIGDNRIGITQEVLTGLASLNLDLAAMEVVTHHIYIDIPDLNDDLLPSVVNNLLAIEGIQHIRQIDLLPAQRRRLHLDALLSTLPDPVFAIDAEGKLLSANTAATTPLGVQEQDLIGKPVNQFIRGDFHVDTHASRLTGNKQQLPKEVTLANQSYLLDTKPIYQHDKSARPIGSMLLLHAAPRLGTQISSVQMNEHEGFDSIVGHASVLEQAKERARRFATINAPLLIQGDTGTGKELFARAIHQSGPGKQAAFLALNCAALPENLVESELFGYAPGAFSGAAHGGKPGLFEMADGGTVFLDEIGEMSPYIQAKLLRFLQDGSFRRVGGKNERRVSVRVISATHRNLEDLVQQGLFREDLMYRLTVLTLSLPALARLKEDIPLLTDRFVSRAATQIGRTAPAVSDTALTMLINQDWPGNIRQLQNTLFKAVALVQGNTIEADDLFESGITAKPGNNATEPESWKSAVAIFEQDLLKRLYRNYPSTRKLAKRLKLSHTTVATKLRQYNIT